MNMNFISGSLMFDIQIRDSLKTCKLALWLTNRKTKLTDRVLNYSGNNIWHCSVSNHFDNDLGTG